MSAARREITDALDRLSRSAFRRRQKLSLADAAEARRRGRDVIRRHAYDLLADRLAPAEPTRDGKQTPFRGHAVFTAQHATATCCRGCLAKWYRIAKGRPMTDTQLEFAVALNMAWLDRQLDPHWRVHDSADSSPTLFAPPP